MATPESHEHYCLTEVALFQDLSRREMADFAAHAPLRTVAAGQVLYNPLQPTETLYIVKRGRVRLYRISIGGQSVTTALAGPGDIFGEVTAIGLHMAATWAEALEPSDLCLMSRHDVRQLLLSDPRIAEQLGARITDLEQRLTDLTCKNLAERVASTLWSLTRTAPTDSTAEPVRLTHQQLAGLIGATRERTTTALGELAEHELIRPRRGKILITDRQRLGTYAEGSGRTAIT